MTKLSLWAGRLFLSLKREDGQSLVEWTLILALVSIVAVAVLEAIGVNVVAKLGSVRDSI